MAIDGWTIALQAVNFLVLVWLLRRFLYRPVLAVIAARQEEMTRTRTAAEEARTAAEAARRVVEEERAGLAAERDRLLAQSRAAAVAERDALLDTARKEADRLLAETRTRVGRERDEALAGLKSRTLSLGSALSERLLRDAAEQATPALFERACAALAAETPERRHTLLPPPAALADGRPAVVRVAAAVAPDAETQQAWGRRLSTLLGQPVTVDITVDPALVAGVEVHFPAMVLTQSWRDALTHAREELSDDADPHPIP